MPAPKCRCRGGSFARTEIAAEAGGNDGTLGWFAAVEGIRDDGYRDHSAARIGRLYARVDSQVASDQLNVGLSLADNHIEGTQALPVSMLDNPRQPYTWPDTTDNRLAFVNGNWLHAFAPDTLLAGNAYFRRISTSGVNSNVNDEYAPPEQSNEAVNLFTSQTTRGWGASLQLTLQRTAAGVGHQMVVGMAYDTGKPTSRKAGSPRPSWPTATPSASANSSLRRM